MRSIQLVRATDAGAALALMRAGGSGTNWLAGCTTPLDLMKLDVMAPALMIDISAIEQEHGQIEAGPAGLRLGTLVCMADAAAHARSPARGSDISVSEGLPSRSIQHEVASEIFNAKNSFVTKFMSFNFFVAPENHKTNAFKQSGSDTSCEF